MSKKTMKRYRLTAPLQQRTGFKQGAVYRGYAERGLVWLMLGKDEFSFHPAEVEEAQP